MKSPEQAAKTGRTIGKVFFIILLAGVALAAFPFVAGIDDSNAIGMVVMGGFLALMGLIGVTVTRGRDKKFKTLLSGESIIDQWEDPDPEIGTVILSTEGFYLFGELYTMKGYSCYISKAELKDGKLFIQYHMAKRNGHSRHKADVDVPPGHEAGVQRFIEAVKVAWGDKPLPAERETFEEEEDLTDDEE